MPLSALGSVAFLLCGRGLSRCALPPGPGQRKKPSTSFCTPVNSRASYHATLPHQQPLPIVFISINNRYKRRTPYLLKRRRSLHRRTMRQDMIYRRAAKQRPEESRSGSPGKGSDNKKRGRPISKIAVQTIEKTARLLVAARQCGSRLAFAGTHPLLKAVPTKWESLSASA